MRRVLFIFLLLVLPFQMAWASAAPYCAHEVDASASKHFGHHEHKHAAGGELTPAIDGNEAESGAHHADCESCHLGCSGAFSSPSRLIGSLPPADALRVPLPSYASHIPAGPERPDRSQPAPAARFGGGVVFGSLQA